MHVSTLLVVAESTIFFIVMVNTENRNVLLVSRSFIGDCCWSLKWLTLEREVCEQPLFKLLL
jgi:hypothetical protein